MKTQQGSIFYEVKKHLDNYYIAFIPHLMVGKIK